jgi:prolyl-tRNA synthetase
MGCYGIGITRTVAAAIEQHHDADGIIWPRALAPFDVLLQPLAVKDEPTMQTTRTLADALEARGLAVLVDDRDTRPGFKFKDGDLIGIPLRVTLGQRTLAENALELKRRGDDTARKVPLDGAVEEIIRVHASCP